MVDETAIMNNLFYLSRPNHPKPVKHENSVSTVLHKAMKYTCVDGQGPAKHVNIELVDLIEKSAKVPKKRSLIFMKIEP